MIQSFFRKCPSRTFYFLSLFFLVPHCALAQTLENSPTQRMLLGLESEIDRLLRTFREDPYQEKNPLQPLDSQWRKLGFIPFARAYGQNVYPNTVPSADERGVAVEAFAARGETEPLSFAVRALDQGISGLAINTSGLVCLDTVGYIPPDSIKLGVVEYFRVRWGSGSGAKAWRWHPVRIWPWNRYPGSRFSRPLGDGRLWVAPNTTQRFWLTVHTPLNVPAGSYTGSIFLDGDKSSYTIPLNFTVLPVELEGKKLIPHGVFVPGAQDQAAVRDLASHGIKAIAQRYDPVELPASADRSGIVFDFSLLDAFLGRLSSAGITGPYLFYAGSPVQTVFDSVIVRLSGVKPDSPEFLAAYARAVQGIFEHTRRKYGDRLIWGIFDLEDRDRKCLPLYRSRAKALRTFMGQALPLVSPVLGKAGKVEKESYGPYADIWLQGGEQAAGERIEGAQVWTYAACTQLDSAAGSRYKAGFGPWVKGADGVLIWAYNWPGGGHAWNDFDSPRMDWMLSYRDMDDRYIPTPSWEGLREGIDDCRYILTLENLIESLPADNPERAEAAKIFPVLKSFFDISEKQPGKVQFPPESPPSTDNTPPGLARRLIAGHLIRLVKSR